MDETESTEGAEIGPKLSKSTLDRIGHELRSTYRREEPKPDYLGDEHLPPVIEDKLTRLDAIPVVHEKGVTAVARALGLDDDNSGPS